MGDAQKLTIIPRLYQRIRLWVTHIIYYILTVFIKANTVASLIGEESKTNNFYMLHNRENSYKT